MKIGIIADDITGLNAIGAEFARFGMESLVVFKQKEIPLGRLEKNNLVICHDTNSRDGKVGDAMKKVASATNMFTDLGFDWIMKQSDSALKGHVFSELIAFKSKLANESLYFAPSCPSIGRYIIGGKLFFDSQTQPIEISDLLGGYPNHSFNFVDSKDLKKLKQNESDFFIVNASKDAELMDVIFAASNRKFQYIAGSVGLAKALATFLWIDQNKHKKPVVLISGSLQKQTNEQYCVLLKSGMVSPFKISTDINSEDDSTLIDSICNAVNNGKSPLLIVSSRSIDKSYSTGSYPSLSVQIREKLKKKFKHILKCLHNEIFEKISGYVITGGTTSEIILRDVFDIKFLEELDHIGDGVVGGIAKSKNNRRIPIVTKAGNWGNDYSLIDAMKWIQILDVRKNEN